MCVFINYFKDTENDDLIIFDGKTEGVSDPCTEAALFWGDQVCCRDKLASLCI